MTVFGDRIGAGAEFRLHRRMLDAVAFCQPLLDRPSPPEFGVGAFGQAGVQRRHVLGAIHRPDMHVVHPGDASHMRPLCREAMSSRSRLSGTPSSRRWPDSRVSAQALRNQQHGDQRPTVGSISTQPVVMMTSAAPSSRNRTEQIAKHMQDRTPHVEAFAVAAMQQRKTPTMLTPRPMMAMTIIGPPSPGEGLVKAMRTPRTTIQMHDAKDRDAIGVGDQRLHPVEAVGHAGRWPHGPASETHTRRASATRNRSACARRPQAAPATR